MKTTLSTMEDKWKSSIAAFNEKLELLSKRYAGV